MKKNIKIFILLLATSLVAVKSHAQVSIGVSVRIAPPALPVYAQPPCPVDGYLWTPGYWAYADDGGYYWVPGVWVAPPRVGFLWTPGYWGYDGGVYLFHQGYWGRHIGFYGGVNYGYGYGGAGYVGGRWAGNSFQYNTAVVNVNNTVVHNTYINKTVINNNVTVNRTSFNGPGGVNAQARPEELAAAREQHVQPTNDQVSHQQVAGKDHNQFASANNGRPATAAMNKVDGNRFNTEGRRARTSSADGTNNIADRNNRPQANNNPDNHNPANQDNANKSASPANQPARTPHQWQTGNNPNAGNAHQPAQHPQANNMARAPRQLVRHPAPGRPHPAPRPEGHERHR